ncbi:hypothetical protein FDA52_01245 [Clostridium botulinum]|nr:hypothetical protein [Clostridium botulinum]
MERNINTELTLQYLNNAFDFSLGEPNDFAKSYIAVKNEIEREFKKDEYSDVSKPLPTYSDVKKFFKK